MNSEPIDPSQLLMVHATTEVIEERVEEDPPQLAIDVEDDEFRKQLLESAKKGAYAYDAYRDLRQISFLHYSAPESPHFMHFMFCDDPEADATKWDMTGDSRSVSVFDAEQELMAAIGNYLSNHYMSCQGQALKWRWLTGWKVGTDIWPMLLNKMLKYGAYIPDVLKTDITRRFSTVPYLLDVSNIYGQGVSMNMRRVPACADALKYWGYKGAWAYAGSKEVCEYVCTDPLRAVPHIELYLEDMFNIVLRYEDIGEPWRQ